MFRLLLCAWLAWGAAPASAGQSAELRALSERIREHDLAAELAPLRALSARIRAAVEASETGHSELTLEKTWVLSDTVGQRWSHGVISIQVKGSAVEALEELNWIPKTLAMSLPRYPLPVGIADAGYMFARDGATNSATLYFVKGEKLVFVSGRSEAVATSLARIVARELP